MTLQRQIRARRTTIKKDSVLSRNSETHPLRINVLPAGNAHLGLTLCPGKQGESVFGEPWARDLSTDVKAIRNWGAEHVVTLMESAEMDLLRVPALGRAVEEAGMAWHHLPIRDLKAPDDPMAWAALSTRLHQALDAGENVLIHCRGGLGRAGTIAALLMIERGDIAKDAMERVRSARPGAIETSAQVRFLQTRAALPDRRTKALRAALFGCAIGDALGAEIEFLGLDAIRRRFPDGLNAIVPHDGRAGAITDDTQMTLFTAEGLCRSVVRGADRGICHPPGIIDHALLRWLMTQGERPGREICDIGLVSDPRLHNRRAPGMTCLSALKGSRMIGELARNDSKGCGTIMRVSPIAFLEQREQVAQLAREASALTHGHPTGQDAAAAWALILHDVLRGENLEYAARTACSEVNAETAEAINRARDAPRDGKPETVEALGGGWVADEALAIALYACLCAKDPETGWQIAVTHSGDSDSTGAIAGTLLGVMHPDAVMAHRWRRQVECADLIDRLARDLAWLTGPDMTSDLAFAPVALREETATIIERDAGDRIWMQQERDPAKVGVSTYHAMRQRYPGW